MVPALAVVVAALGVFHSQSAAGELDVAAYDGIVLAADSTEAEAQLPSLKPAWFPPGFASCALYVSAAGEFSVVGPVVTFQESSLSTFVEVPSAYHTWSSSFSVGTAACQGSPLDG